MASTEKYPITPGVRVLRAAGVSFGTHLYEYVEKGGTRHSANALGVDEHCIIKTLVMETESKAPLLILMHGDHEVATGLLARTLGVKSIRPCDAATAQKHTGYLFGGTSPFGTRNSNIPVCAERTIFDLPLVYINGGKRGFLVSLAPHVLTSVLHAQEVDVAAPESDTSK